MNCKYCPFSYDNTEKRSGENFLVQQKTTKEVLTSTLFTPNSFESLVIYGGEPLLHEKQIKKIVEEYLMFRKNGRVTLCTNGFLLDDNMISYCKKYSIDVAINLDGNKELVGSLKKITNSDWNGLMVNIHKLKTQGISFDFSTTITPQFLLDFDAHIAFLESFQPRMIGFNFLRDQVSQNSFGIADPSLYLIDAMSRVYAYNSPLNFNRGKKFSCYSSNSQEPDCICSGLGLTILADGSLTTCGIFQSQECSSIPGIMKLIDENMLKLHNFDQKQESRLSTFGGGCVKLNREDNLRFACLNAQISHNQFNHEKL